MRFLGPKNKKRNLSLGLGLLDVYIALAGRSHGAGRLSALYETVAGTNDWLQSRTSAHHVRLSLSLVCVFNIRATLFPFAETRQSHATGVSQVHNFDTLSLAKVFFSFLDSGQSRTFFLFFFSFLIGRPIGKVENKKRRQKKMIFLSFVVWPTISESHVDIFDCESE